MTIQRPQTPTTPAEVDHLEYDERQPLLGASDSPSDSDTTPVDVNDKQRNWNSTVVRGVFVFLGAAILGLIVKCFLDANVEVRVLPCNAEDWLKSTSVV